jgi:hypothetical protein
MGKSYKEKRIRKGNVVVPYTCRAKWF